MVGLTLAAIVTACSGTSRPDCSDWNIADYFISATEKEVAECLAAGAEVTARNEIRVTPLHNAARDTENPAVIEALLAAGADINARDKVGFTPLHSAASLNENPAVIEALLAAGASIHDHALLGVTALHLAAAYNENPAVIEALLAGGAEIYASLGPPPGQTPLELRPLITGILR